MTNEMEFLSDFGDELLSPSTGSTCKTGEALTGKTVLIYFSAHWCPPCRKFTPKLIEFYKNLKADTKKGGENFELVFVSLDRSESEYKDYTSDMPWMCTPFSLPKDLKSKLQKKYGAQGIPHLVVVNATEDRQVITKDGTEGVSEDPLGKNFPWKPKSFAEIWAGKQILTKDSSVGSSTFDDKYLMLYFSAHWCPPCRGFTPTLGKAYQELKAQRQDFELVFVSSDRDDASFQGYFDEMPFWALAFEERETKQELSKHFDVQGIPSLIMLGPVPEGGGDRPLINPSLRGVIETGDFSEFPFCPKPYSDLSKDSDGISEKRCLVVFCEGCDDDEQSEIIDLVKTISEKMKDRDMGFFYATSPGGMVNRVREALKIKDKMDNAVMALLDIPDNGGYYLSDVTNLTESEIEKFIASPGERLQLA